MDLTPVLVYPLMKHPTSLINVGVATNHLLGRLSKDLESIQLQDPSLHQQTLRYISRLGHSPLEKLSGKVHPNRMVTPFNHLHFYLSHLAHKGSLSLL